MDNDQQPLTLRDVALRASQRAGGLQGRALDREAKRRGLTLSYTTVDKIIAGTYNSRPTSKTLEALAALAEIPLAQVYEAARLPIPSKRLADQLPPDADLLDEAQRRVVIDVVRAFAGQNRELDAARRRLEDVTEDAQHTAPNRQAEGSSATRRDPDAEKQEEAERLLDELMSQGDYRLAAHEPDDDIEREQEETEREP